MRRVLILSLTACTAPQAVAPGNAAPDVPAQAAAPGAPVAIRFAPSGAAARLYNVPAPAAAGAPLAEALVALVEKAAREADRSVPEIDGRLQAAAHDLAAAMPAGGSMPYAAVEFALQHYGVVEPTPAMLVIRSSSAEADVPDGIAGRLRQLVESGRYGRVGAATAVTADSAITVVLLLKSFVDMQPLPRMLERSGQVELRARIIAPYSAPQLFVTLPGGEVKKSQLEPQKDGRVRAALRCDAGGMRQVELLGQDELGPSVLANFPIWCGEDPPRELSVTIEALDTSASGIDAAERRLLELVNRERVRAALPRLEWDARVAGIARAHSSDMVRSGIVAHTMPKSGTAADRVRAGGVATALVQENLARAASAEEAHVGLMNSPSHRANVLSPDVTHMGAGIAFDESLTRDMLVTELFIRIPPPVDAGEARRGVAARLQKAARSLRPDVELERIAQARALELARGQDSGGVAAKVADELVGLGSYDRVRTVVSALARVDDFDAKVAAQDRSMSHFGIGIGQGEHPRLGPNTIYVVIVLAGGTSG